MAVVRSWLGFDLAGRNDDLPGLHTVGLPGQWDDRPALDPARFEPDPRIAHVGGRLQGHPVALGRPRTGRGVVPALAVVVRFRALTACFLRYRWRSRGR